MDFTEITHNNQTFRYHDQGAGPTIVLFHGFPDGPTSWEPTVTALVREGYRCIVPYLRGYHRSTIVESRPYNDATTTEDARLLLDALELDHVTIIGHDWGASSAWNLASESPERVDAIVPIAIPHPSQLKPDPKLAWAVRHFVYFKLPGSSRRAAQKNFEYIRSLYTRWSPNWTDPTRQETCDAVIDMFREPIVFHHALNWYRALPLRPQNASQKPLDCHGFVVGGEHDFGIPAVAYDRSASLCAGISDSLVVDNAGHWPHREQPELFQERLVAFLANVYTER